MTGERDLTREQKDALAAEIEAITKRAPVEGVHAQLHDDRSRAVAEGKRVLGSRAAELAQEHLKIAEALMRMAGNSIHNSPNGFDRVAEEALDLVFTKGLDSLREVQRLRGTLHQWVWRGGWRGK